MILKHIYVDLIYKEAYNQKMDYTTFKRYVGRAGFKLYEFSELVGMNRRAISNYSRKGTVPRHLALIVMLMAELDHKKRDTRGIVDELNGMGLPQKKNRIPGFKGSQLKRNEIGCIQ
jgi:hypothetical protein